MGKPAFRQGDLTTGHPPFAPVQAVQFSRDVKVNGKPAVRQGDKFEKHCSKGGCHVGAATGSQTVFVNGKPMARTGDPLTCGDKAGKGSSNVLVG
jgi:uncharacterized Zn-binding protein involved in type VI secretion